MDAKQAIRRLIWLNIPVYLAIGLASLLAPTWVAGLVDIELGSPTALADFRAMYGGLSLGAGATMWIGVGRDSWLQPLLTLVGACAAELALGRAYSWLVAGTPSTGIVVLLGLELACVGLALWCHRALVRQASRDRGGHAVPGYPAGA